MIERQIKPGEIMVGRAKTVTATLMETQKEIERGGESEI